MCDTIHEAGTVANLTGTPPPSPSSPPPEEEDEDGSSDARLLGIIGDQSCCSEPLYSSSLPQNTANGAR